MKSNTLSVAKCFMQCQPWNFRKICVLSLNVCSVGVWQSSSITAQHRLSPPPANNNNMYTKWLSEFSQELGWRHSVSDLIAH